VLVLACGVDGPSAPTGVVALSVERTAITVVAGASDTTIVRVLRMGRAAGSVEVSVEGLRAGVTAPSVVIPAGSSSAHVILSAAPAAVPDTLLLTVRARSPGLRDRTVVLSLVVMPALPAIAPAIPATDTTAQAPVTPTAATTAPSATPAIAPLESGMAVREISGAAANVRVYRISVPVGARRLVARTSGGTGDVDMYVRHLAPPLPGAPADCRSEGEANDHLCVIAMPAPGEWFVLLHGRAGYHGVTLAGSTTAGEMPEGTVPEGIAPATGYALAAFPAHVSLAPGEEATIAVAATRASGFADFIALAGANLPGGLTVIISPTPLHEGMVSTITLRMDPRAPSGRHTVSFRGRTPDLPDVMADVALTVRPATVDSASTSTAGYLPFGAKPPPGARGW